VAHEVRQLVAGRQMRRRGASACPQPERAIHMHPSVARPDLRRIVSIGSNAPVLSWLTIAVDWDAITRLHFIDPPQGKLNSQHL
jgi:hypothetical protein